MTPAPIPSTEPDSLIDISGVSVLIARKLKSPFGAIRCFRCSGCPCTFLWGQRVLQYAGGLRSASPAINRSNTTYRNSMPLPTVTKTNRCTARTKSRNLEPCLNPRAYRCKTCRVHGARKPTTILRGKDHPAYKDGSQTVEAKAEYSAAAARLRTLEQIMVDTGMVSADFKRTRGRKPK